MGPGPHSSFPVSTGQVASIPYESSGEIDQTNLGPPEPIKINHATWAVVGNNRNLSTVKGRENQSWAMWRFEGSGGR